MVSSSSFVSSISEEESAAFSNSTIFSSESMSPASARACIRSFSASSLRELDK